MKQVFRYQIVAIIIFHFVIIYISGQIWYKKPSFAAVHPIPAKNKKAQHMFVSCTTLLNDFQ